MFSTLTQVIKFMETVILVQTYKSDGGLVHEIDMSLEDIPLTLKVTRRRRLEDEARCLHYLKKKKKFIHILTLILNYRVLFDLLSRYCHSGNVSYKNLTICMGSLSLIAKYRVLFIEKVLTLTETLASKDYKI